MENETEILKRRITVLENLLAVSRRLNSTLEMRPLLLQIVEVARELTRSDAASILLLENGETLRFAASCGPYTNIEVLEIPIENSLAGWVVQNRQTAIVEDAITDPRMYSLETVGIPPSIVAAPMLFGDKMIGVLEVLTFAKHHKFTPQDVETMETLASIAAVAVQNTRLFQQNDWISEIVHELRTPLTAILSYAELLERPTLSAERQQQFVHIIQQETERVTSMVNQFLELARLESGRVSMKQQSLELPEIISRSMNVLLPKAREREMHLATRIADSLPPLNGDAERLHQVLLNLISNAIKYSNDGDTITIACDPEPNRVVISVIDTGPGIPEDQLPCLFQRFARLPGSEKRAIGSGLGLSIARQIVEAHGGQIWATSKVGEGSTFAFSLPIPCEAQNTENDA